MSDEDKVNGTYDVVIQRPGDSWARVVGERRFVSRIDASDPRWDAGVCPQCGAEVDVYEVDVENQYLKGGKGKATYCHCSACPWESEMVARSDAFGDPDESTR